VFTQDDDNVGQLDLIEVSYWNNNRGDAATNSGGNSSKGPVGSASDVKVEVSGSGQVTLQGQTISGKPMLADIKKIYGEPDRTWDKKGAANRIHTWDNLGLVVYEPFNGRAISLTMPYKASAVSKDFAPPPRCSRVASRSMGAGSTTSTRLSRSKTARAPRSRTATTP
jgi:hypothetical protein